MSLVRLLITHVRNIQQATLAPGPGINIVYGDNGSGKTSLLEAIQILATGKSFRTPHIRSIIHHDSDYLRVFGEINAEGHITPAGIERHHHHTRIRIAGKDVKSISELAFLLPVQYLGPESHRILDLGPRFRRQLVDWGVFHVEPVYYGQWMRFQRLLKQRNAALRDRRQQSTLAVWDKDLVETAMELTEQRRGYLQRLAPLFSEYLRLLSSTLDIQYIYMPGWPENMAYGEVLANAGERDKKKGFTQYGPHRADIVFKLGTFNARDELSRGQQKIAIHAFRLAQVALLQQESGRGCIILVDDLPSELDHEHLQNILQALAEFKTQVFITAIQGEQLTGILAGEDLKMFHVERGNVKEVV
jgi:DNA replication and repair protein RecF